jgi:hypothetical protein
VEGKRSRIREKPKKAMAHDSRNRLMLQSQLFRPLAKNLGTEKGV